MALFNPGYSPTYNPYIAQPTQNNGINWVQGIEGAKAYQLAPNGNVVLLDSENEGRFYIKVSDNVGMCTLRIFKYEEIVNNPTPGDYVTKSELKAEIEAVINSMLGGNTNEQSVSTTKFNKTITS